MRVGSKRGKLLVMGSWIAAVTSLGSSSAVASTLQHHHYAGSSDRQSEAALHGRGEQHETSRHRHHAWSRHDRRHVAERGISCVPFARMESGIELAGNASEWWNHAAGVYARGENPEAGSILNFRSTGHMRLGHVAVVEQVIDSRHIIVDHANWGGPGLHGGMVSRGVRVEDVSDNNDWSDVRVELGHDGVYGSVYPTYGFIYARNDDGKPMTVANRGVHIQRVMVSMASDPHEVSMHDVAQTASNTTDNSANTDNAVQNDLHIVAMRAAQHSDQGFEEVAEAPKASAQKLELRIYRDYK